MRATDQKNNNSGQKHKAIENEFDTMVEADNHLNKHTDLAVVDKQLNGVNQGTLGFGNCTTLAVIQYLFNMFGQATLKDKDFNNESTRIAYEPTTPIYWVFDHIYKGKNYAVATN